MKDEIIGYEYDYANKCDCADDDNCGCDYPNNMPRNFSPIFAPIKEQKQYQTTHLTIGMTAPDFTAPTVLLDETVVEHFNFYKAINNKNAILFFYPEDFSFTCPSELIMLNNELDNFTHRNTKVFAISTDSIYSHLTWKQLPPTSDGISDINFPLIADLDKTITKNYNLLSANGEAERGTIIIDNNKIIRHISINDKNLYRTPQELLRIIDLINDKSQDTTSCPKGWKRNSLSERPNHKL